MWRKRFFEFSIGAWTGFTGAEGIAIRFDSAEGRPSLGGEEAKHLADLRDQLVERYLPLLSTREQARLRNAVGHGSDLAMACTLPGSVSQRRISQRKYERLGFRVAYTKVLMIKEW